MGKYIKTIWFNKTIKEKTIKKIKTVIVERKVDEYMKNKEGEYFGENDIQLFLQIVMILLRRGQKKTLLKFRKCYSKIL